MTMRFGNPGEGVVPDSPPLDSPLAGSYGTGEVTGASTGGGAYPYVFEHPIPWNQLRKYFNQMLPEQEAKKLIGMLEENSKALEDFLDVAYLKTNGGTIDGYTRFKGVVEFQNNVIGVPPTGSIIQFAGGDPAVVPAGWLLANGQEVAIADYGNLYNVLTNTGAVFPYGSNTNGSGGAGSTHFRLPNLKSRFPVGYDSSNTDYNTMGKTGGAASVTPNVSTTNVDALQAFNRVVVTNVSGSTNIPPYITLNYIVKY